jgi:hypothetical protein
MALPSFRSLLVQRLPDGVKITPRIAGGIPLQPFIVRGPDPESSCDAFIAALGACVDVIRLVKHLDQPPPFVLLL